MRRDHGSIVNVHVTKDALESWVETVTTSPSVKRTERTWKRMPKDDGASPAITIGDDDV
jgi:hypothetical protein